MRRLIAAAVVLLVMLRRLNDRGLLKLWKQS